MVQTLGSVHSACFRFPTNNHHTPINVQHPGPESAWCISFFLTLISRRYPQPCGLSTYLFSCNLSFCFSIICSSAREPYHPIISCCLLTARPLSYLVGRFALIDFADSPFLTIHICPSIHLHPLMPVTSCTADGYMTCSIITVVDSFFRP